MSNSFELLEQLTILSHYHRLAFAVSCCERLVPNYYAFVVSTGDGNTEVVQHTIEMLWHNIVDRKLDEQKARHLLQACMDIIPDSEDYTSIFTGLAIEALSALIYTLQSSLDESIEHIVGVSQLVIDSNSEYLHIVNAPGIQPYADTADLEQWIKQSPLMKAELEKQAQDILILQADKELRGKTIDQIKASSRKIGIHPVERGLIRVPQPSN